MIRRGLAWVAMAVVAALLVSLVATFAGPGWQPVPVTERVPVATADTTVAPALGPEASTPVGTYGVDLRQTTLELAGGVTVEASIRLPEGAEGPVPGVVVMHGTGTAGANAFYDLTTALASAGIASIVPGKRSDTYTLWHRDYRELAGDYRRAMELLASTPGVDPERVGVYGESEGALIAPILAAEHPETAFVVLVSSPVVPLRWQGAAAADSYLRNTHVPQTVFPVIPRLVGATMPGGVLAYLDTDERAYLERLHQPVFTAYGTGDASMPLIQGAAEIERALIRAGELGNRPAAAGPGGGSGRGSGGGAAAPPEAAARGEAPAEPRAWGHTVRYYEDGSHGIRLDHELIEEWPRDLARWIGALPASADAAPRVAGAEPAQRFVAGPVPAPGPWASGWLLPSGVVVPLIVLLVGVGAAIVARVRELRVMRGGRLVRRAAVRDGRAGSDDAGSDGEMPAADAVAEGQDGRAGPDDAAPLVREAVRRRRDVRVAAWRGVLMTLALAVGHGQWMARTLELALNYQVDDRAVRDGLVVVYLLAVVTVGMILAAAIDAGRARREWLAAGGEADRGLTAHRVAVGGLVLGSALLLLTLAYWGALPLWR